MTIQTVQISNTFNEFRETTNLVIDEVNKLGDGTGNLVIDTIIANTFVGVSSDLNIVGDTGNDVVSLTTDSLVFSGANGISTSVTSGSNTVIVNLNNTGVSANTYGSASKVPIITVDAQGRITAASNVNVAGVSNFQYYSSNANFVINTADGGSFPASIGQDLGTSANVTFQDLTVTGNVVFTGNVVSVTANNLVVEDNIIQLAKNNVTDVVDIGFVGHYFDGANVHAGLFRDATDSTWKLFQNYPIEPGANTNIDTSNADFEFASIKAHNIEANGIFVGSGSELTNLNASNVSSGTLSSARLATSGVAAGTYGSTSQVPVIVVDDKGRITSASNVSISSSMTVAGNTGNDVISFATETLRIVGTNGISTSVSSGSNTITINLDSTSTKIAANTLVYTFNNPNLYEDTNTSAPGDHFGYTPYLTNSYIMIPALYEANFEDDILERVGLYIYDADSKKLINFFAPDTSSVYYYYYQYGVAKDNYLLVPEVNTKTVHVYNITEGKLLHKLGSPSSYNTGTNDQFGLPDIYGGYRNIAVYDDYAIIGAPLDGSFEGAAYIFNYKTGQLLYSFFNPNALGSGSDRFGNSVGIYGDLIIVGATLDDPSTSSAGTAYVFNYKTNTLLHTKSLPGGGTANNKYFGKGVAIGKKYFAISTPNYDITYTGLVCIYDNATGNLVKQLTATDANINLNSFGASIEMRDNYLFISGYKSSVVYNIDNDTFYKLASGASNDQSYISVNDNYLLLSYSSDTTTFPRVGRGSLYSWKDIKTTSFSNTAIKDVEKIEFSFGKTLDKNNSVFNLPNISTKYAPTELVHRISSPESITSNFFGKKTALTNKYIIASSNSTANTGNVHVYDLKSGTLKYFLTNPNPVGSTANDAFGSTLAADDTYLAVGSFEDDVANTDSGKVYVYQIDTGGLLYTLNNPTANGTSANDFFGTSGLVLANNFIAVGAHGEANTIYSNTGIVYVYSIPTFTSNIINTATRIIYNPEHANNDYFGSSIATDGRFITVGAYNKTVSSNTGAGKAYVFELSTGSLVNKLLPDSSNTNDYFGYSIAMDDEFIAVGAYNKNNGANTAVGNVYIYRTKYISFGSNNVIRHVVTNPNLLYFSANDKFGFSVSLNNRKLAVNAVGERGNGGGYANSGIIYLYDVDFDSCNLVNVIYPDDWPGGIEDEFGYNIASNRNYIVTTAEFDSPNADVGRIYVYATRPVRDMQIPELSQVERITLADGTQITSTTAVTTSNINKYAAGSYLYLSSNFGGF